MSYIRNNSLAMGIEMMNVLGVFTFVLFGIFLVVIPTTGFLLALLINYFRGDTNRRKFAPPFE